MRVPDTTWGRRLRLGKSLIIIFDHSVLFVILTEEDLNRLKLIS